MLHAGSGTRAALHDEYGTLPVASLTKDKMPNKQYLFPLDWALITIDDSRKMVNELPETSIKPQGAKTKMVQRQLCDSWMSLNQGKLNIRRYEVEVAKHGRTTEWTFGIVSSCLTKINPKEDKAWETMAEVYGFTDKNVGNCYSVISRGKGKFVIKGDSGSIIVHDPSGVWLGLLFGESATGTGLMLPMDLVFNDIKKVTGFTVVKPKFVADTSK